jgi:hypothetical protein
MGFIHIHKKNCKEGNCDKVLQLDNLVAKKNTKIFLLIFMEGCGPCNATRPEWSKLKNVIPKPFLRNNNIIIADIDHISSEKLKNVTQPSGFPNMTFITDGGETVEKYEDCNIEVKDRTIDSFVKWIEFKTGKSIEKTKKNNTKKNYTKKNNTKKNNTKKNYKGGKWSRKYKKSINCKRPKGFSQKQFCKYGKK